MVDSSDVIAPKAFILPRHDGDDQRVSGAMWMSGADLLFFPYGGGANPYVVTASELS